MDGIVTTLTVSITEWNHAYERKGKLGIRFGFDRWFSKTCYLSIHEIGGFSLLNPGPGPLVQNIGKGKKKRGKMAWSWEFVPTVALDVNREYWVVCDSERKGVRG